MVERKTMRPVTLRRIIEICTLACQNSGLNVEIVSAKLGLTHSRSKEILLEVERMGLLSRSENFWKANNQTMEFLEYFEKEQLDKIHQYFLNNYQFYREFIQILQDNIKDDHGLSIKEIIEEARKLRLHINSTAAEVLADWCERLGIVQRNLYTGRVYLIKSEVESTDNFFKTLVKLYRKFSYSPGRKEIFVEIPLIRESTCENLKISREIFDTMLREVYLRKVGEIELSGAPVTTLAKKSPLSEKKIVLVGKNAILSAESTLKKEREGLTVNKKSYYYLAIHDISI